MGERTKKRIIAALLLVSCIISGYMLASVSAPPFRELNNLSEADSLLLRHFESFNIPRSQVSVRTVRVDSNFSRKQYRVRVPPGFSKTQLHAEITEGFYPRNVSAPARVRFPQLDLSIYLAYRNTVIRTVTIETDPGLVMERNPASIMVAFEDHPEDELVRRIVQFGEPIAILLALDDPVAANEARKELVKSYPHLTFLVGEEGRSLEGPGEIYFLEAESGRIAFDRVIQQFVQKARAGGHPLALVSASEEALTWLNEHLAELKKAGLRIVSSPYSPQ